MPATVGFPALTDHGCGSRSALALFDTSGNGGGSFTFTGHVTGN
jgi:hypothetical protein